MSVARDELKLAVAVFRSPSEANPVSRDELNASCAAIRDEKDPLSTTSPAISLAIDELVEVNEPDISSAI